MANTDVFNRFDMVVSITEKTINDQLNHLVRMGIVHPELIIVQKLVPNAQGEWDFSYVVCKTESDISKEKNGDVMYATLKAGILPQIAIDESGDRISFILKFREGSAWFWSGVGTTAKLKKYDVTGWSYGLKVNLDLARLHNDDLAKQIKAPDFVKEELTSFMSKMFDIRHLFINFEAVSLTEFDPAHTTTGTAGQFALQQLITFMKFYLTNLLKDGNPFILGYSIVQNDSTKPDPDSAVPDTLKPVGT